jgi:mono/diheme cytochrome c family protein
VPVLGFGALQLSPQLRDLVEAGFVRNLPPDLLDTPPRIPAPTPLARAALGYLHGNCGHCHNANDAAPPVDLRLEQTGAAADVAAAWRSLVEQDTQYRRGTAPIVPGDPHASVLVARMRSREPAAQMPPLGTRLRDDAGLALVERWIDSLAPTVEPQP